MIKKYILLLMGLLYLSPVSIAHHYKGLPHNSYFENYPQVPTLEFLHEDEKWEIFLTVYNFQGINLDSVADSNMIRLYIFLYDVRANTPHMKPTQIEIYSHGKLIHQEMELLPEEESIYSIHKKIDHQDNLELKVYFKTKNGNIEAVILPFKITKSFMQKYGVIFFIILFFVIIGFVKKIIISKSSEAMAKK